jgi:HIRAN domain
MKVLYLAWQDPKDRRWSPVGRLSFDGGVYRFVYTKGALKSPNFLPFGMMQDLYTVYESSELFPLFANRLLSKTRPEYKAFLDWLNIRNSEDDPLTLLGRSEGLRGTDSLTVFPLPEKGSDGTYRVHFFSHGLRYLPDCAVQVVEGLRPGSRLFLMPDPQNRHDTYAVALRTDDPVMIVGYCPRYLSQDFLFLLKTGTPDTPEVVVERVNKDAPIQLRLLCSFRTPWPASFEPCSDEEYEVLA